MKPYILPLILFTATLVLGGIPFGMNPMGVSTRWTPRLPVAYQEVEYLESTGTQWIDTGITRATDTTDYSIGFTFTRETAQNVAVFGDSRLPRFCLIYLGSSAGVSCRLFHGGPTATNFDPVPFIVGEPYTLDCKNNVITYTCGTTSETLTFPSFGEVEGFEMRLFTAGIWLPAELKITHFRYGIDGTPVRDYVPCVRTADSVAGMYDLVNGTFATNKGTGSFITGPTVGVSP